MSCCCVVGCGSRHARDRYSFYRIPKIIYNGTQQLITLSQIRRAAWLALINRADMTQKKTETQRVCQKHFIKGKPSALEETSDPDWMPTQNMGYATNVVLKIKRKQDRRIRSAVKKVVASIPDSVLETPDQVEASDLLPSDVRLPVESSDLIPSDVRWQDEASDLIPSPSDVRARLQVEASDLTASDVRLQSSDLIFSDVLDVEMKSETKSIDEYVSPIMTRDQETQTNLTGKEIDLIIEESRICNSTIYDLREKISSKNFDERSFVNADKVKYFTGLPTSKHLSILLKAIENYLPAHHRNSLTKFQMFLIVFMKLRLNLPFKYLSYTFDCSPVSISHHFYFTLNVMFHRLKSLVALPQRENFLTTMPLNYRQTFGDKIAVILDCLEIPTEMPSDSAKQAQLWSHKHQYAVKYLLGITPQGTICFVSKAWGGHTSDEHLVAHCGIFDVLLPGDIVMANRGFSITGEVNTRISAFTKGNTKLNAVHSKDTRSIAHVRGSVERVTELLRKKYPLLNGPIPISMLAMKSTGYCALDQIVCVAAGIVNIFPAQVSKGGKASKSKDLL